MARESGGIWSNLPGFNLILSVSQGDKRHCGRNFLTSIRDCDGVSDLRRWLKYRAGLNLA
jgi:hypothetical protein